nr:hypothetical protein Iba_chr05aCG15850 [Ipomoea batatas]
MELEHQCNWEVVHSPLVHLQYTAEKVTRSFITLAITMVPKGENKLIKPSSSSDEKSHQPHQCCCQWPKEDSRLKYQHQELVLQSSAWLKIPEWTSSTGCKSFSTIAAAASSDSGVSASTNTCKSSFSEGSARSPTARVCGARPSERHPEAAFARGSGRNYYPSAARSSRECYGDPNLGFFQADFGPEDTQQQSAIGTDLGFEKGFEGTNLSNFGSMNRNNSETRTDRTNPGLLATNVEVEFQKQLPAPIGNPCNWTEACPSLGGENSGFSMKREGGAPRRD